MNDRNEERRLQNEAIKDALVEQTWTLSDEEVAREALQRGIDLGAARAQVDAMRERATTVVGDGAKDEVVVLNSSRTAVATHHAFARRRAARPMRLVAGVEPPSNPHAVDPQDQEDRSSSTPDEDTDHTKP